MYVLFNAHYNSSRAFIINSARVIHVFMAHKISYTRPCIYTMYHDRLQAQRVLHFSA